MNCQHDKELLGLLPGHIDLVMNETFKILDTTDSFDLTKKTVNKLLSKEIVDSQNFELLTVTQRSTYCAEFWIVTVFKKTGEILWHHNSGITRFGHRVKLSDGPNYIPINEVGRVSFSNPTRDDAVIHRSIEIHELNKLANYDFPLNYMEWTDKDYMMLRLIT